jgi:hypothetical protein
MIAPRGPFPLFRALPTLSKRITASCNDCYFRREGLCALPGETICPTFRAYAVGRLAPPKQPPLVARPLAEAAAAHAAA